MTEEQRLNRKKYKAAYFQKNKAAILAKRKKPTEEETRKWNFKYHYGLSLEQYNQMLQERNSQCDICGYKQPMNAKRQERLYVDHCHVTGNVRGLLCFRCNSALGYFNDDSDRLDKAKGYLNEYRKKVGLDTKGQQN